MPKPWEKYASGAGGKGPWSGYQTQPLPENPPAGSPDVGVERNVRTLEGDLVDVQRTGMTPVTAGYINGRPVSGKQYVPGKSDSAGFIPSLKAASTHDPEAKKRAFAKARFGKPTVSHLSLEDPTLDPRGVIKVSKRDMDRYRTLPSGEIIYRGDDGVYRSESPRSPFSSAKSLAAHTTADAPQIAGEIAGYAVGGVTGGAIGAGVGEVIQRGAARVLLGEKQNAVDDYVIRPLTTTGVSLAAGGIGKLAGPGVDAVNKAARGMQRTGEVGRLVGNREVIDAAGIEARNKAFERFGIRGDTARVTQSPALAAVQQELGKGTGKAGQMIRAGEQRLKGEIRRAVTGGRGGLPKMEVDPYESGKILVGANKDIEAGIRGARKAQASRLYERAFKEAGDSPINVSGVTDDLKQRIAGATGKREKVLREIYREFYAKKGIREGDRTISYLDDVQKRIRVKAKQLTEHGPDLDKALAGEISSIREGLLDVIGEVSPTYRIATQAYKYRTRALESFENSKFNKSLRELGGDYAHKAPDLLFGASSSPQLIRQEKSRILSEAGGAEKWNKVKRSALVKEIDALDTTLDIAPETMAKLKAAMTPKEYEAFAQFKKVLNDIGYVPWSKRGSGEGRLVMEEQAGGAVRALRRITPSPLVQSTELTRIKLARIAPKIAEELTTGSGIRNILRLKQLSPQSKEYAKIVSGLLGSQLGRHGAAWVRKD
jgi:hypothetical protein